MWAAVAESWLDRGETRAPDFWEALGEIHDHLLLRTLAGRLGEIDSRRDGEMLERIASLFDDDPACTLPGPGQVSRRSIPSASRDRVGRLGRLDVPRADPLDGGADRRLPRAAPKSSIGPDRGVLLNPRRSRGAGRAADRRSPGPAGRIGGPLPLWKRSAASGGSRQAPLEPALSRSPPSRAAPRDARTGRSRGRRISTSCATTRRASDLRRFLDLVDRFFPGEVKRLVEDVAWSPASRPGTLLTLAAETTR